VKLLQRFANDRRGTTAIEYALIGSLIFLAIIVVTGEIGTSLVGIFETVAAGFPT